MTEMFGEAWPPMSVPDLAPDDDDEVKKGIEQCLMTEMFGEAWPPMSVPDLAPDDDDEKKRNRPNSEDG